MTPPRCGRSWTTTASPEYANNRQVGPARPQGRRAGGDVISGFLSAATGADPAKYSPLEQGFLEVLATGDPAGFDGSDQMPGEVGSGTFWREATALVNGDTDAAAAADGDRGLLAELIRTDAGASRRSTDGAGGRSPGTIRFRVPSRVRPGG